LPSARRPSGVLRRSETHVVRISYVACESCNDKTLDGLEYFDSATDVRKANGRSRLRRSSRTANADRLLAGRCSLTLTLNEEPCRPVVPRDSSSQMPDGGNSVRRTTATWLILPVVICLSQRLSHACLSTNLYTVKLRMAH
jgi:hypothetical protein